MTDTTHDGGFKKIRLPHGFDPTNEQHMKKLTMQVQELAASRMPELSDYSLYSIDEQSGYAIYAPIDQVDAVAGSTPEPRYFTVDAGRAANQKRTAQEYEQNNPGWFVVDINMVQRLVTMEQLDEKTLTVRRLFADVLKVDPWKVRVTRTPEGGWKIRINKTARTYVASKYDKAVQEAVDTIGAPGWFFKANPKANVIMVYPGELPTFPKAIPMPRTVVEHPNLRHGYYGMRLPDKGRKTGDMLYNDWKDSPGVLVAGASNGGKSVLINSLVYGFVAGGGMLAVVDEKGKSADFQWVRPWVMDKGWGCDGLESSAAVLRNILRICDERARIINDAGKMNWWGLPDDVKRDNPLLLLVCDEISQWAVAPKVPMGLDKDNPDLIEAKYENAICSSSYISLLKISQKARFAGICFLYAAQSATQQAGLDPKVRLNLTTKLVIGEKVQESIYDNVLNDAKHSPRVPQNVIKEGVGKGCGVSETPGQETCVFKSFYEDDPAHGLEWADILRERLERERPTVMDMSRGAIAWQDVVALVPAAADKPDFSGDGVESLDGSPVEGFGVDGRDVADRDAPLKGAAAAAHVSALELARRTARELERDGI
ncbi:hypothetical protein [Pseudoscardovia suis]|uniref:Cell division protein FtsK n=1 Tax=Pseudoscardovia suis TaxID=987063 RepID=A0A261EPR3_9BIFI|nr:hypothetical protein [Pseudoscardovia suis]OZG48848.1 cell division protein FtsK [Pseudoscardovia suis]PJJ63992.1 hypothetical protein CLV65_1616 [Pseudoscardovia suis]